jgi:hypothetical protein
MIDNLKSNMPTIWRGVAFVISVLALSSCTSVVCLSGLCPDSKEVAAKIPWNPLLLNYQSCLDISGIYKPRNYYGTGFDDLMVQFPSANDRFGFIHATLETLKQVPGRSIRNPSKENPSRMRWDESEFYDNAHVLIKQTANEVVALLIGSDGELYSRQTINLNSSMVGCADGDFIVRTVSVLGGSDGTSKGATATEKRFRKLADGKLQLIRHTRDWYYDPLFGLVGRDSSGSKSSTGMPREEKRTYEWDSLQKN